MNKVLIFINSLSKVVPKKHTHICCILDSLSFFRTSVCNRKLSYVFLQVSGPYPVCRQAEGAGLWDSGGPAKTPGFPLTHLPFSRCVVFLRLSVPAAHWTCFLCFAEHFW